MKRTIFFITTILSMAFNASATERGHSAFSNVDSPLVAKVEKPDGSSEEICLYQENESDEQLVISIKEVFDEKMRHPLYVDAKIFGDELVVLLELQPPVAHFLRQRYKKVNNTWILIAENPVQAMNTLKRQKMVVGKIQSKTEVLFYFHPKAEYEKNLAGQSARKLTKGKSHEEDHVVKYVFSNFTEAQRNAFEQKPKGLFLEVLGDNVKRNEQVYNFRVDDSATTPILGY